MTSPQPLAAPGTGRAHGAAVIGVDGHLVEAEAVISNGPPAFSIAGLPETSVRETRDRIRAAILNSGQPWPTGSVTVNLLPASLPKHGAGLDLPVAVAVLTAAAAVPAEAAVLLRMDRRATAPDDVALPAHDGVRGDQQPQSMAAGFRYQPSSAASRSRSAQFSFGRH